MEGQEFFRISREMLDIFIKGTDLCHEMQSDLNDRYRKGLITHEQMGKGDREKRQGKGLFQGAA